MIRRCIGTWQSVSREPAGRCPVGRSAPTNRDEAGCEPLLTGRRSGARVVTEPRAKGTDMAGYRTALPQLADSVFLTDGGIETTLIFHDGLDLPEFAAFVLLDDREGRDALRRYFRALCEHRARAGCGFVLESAHLAGEPGLGREARLLAGDARRGQPSRHRADGASSAASSRPPRRRWSSAAASALAATATARPTLMTARGAGATTPPRSRPSPTPRPTWSRRSP